MIKLFRRTREKLLKENKLARYFIYAIGEIILVVIGILIALQVNNWNEKRQKKQIEIDILKGIRSDLNSNIESFNQRITNDSLVITYCKDLILIMRDKESTYQNNLDQLFGRINDWSPVHPNRLAYTNLQSVGIATISNDSLRSRIIDLYDQTYLLLEDIEKVIFELYKNGSAINISHLETLDDFSQKRPNDFNALKEVPAFMNYLTYAKSERQQTMNVLKNYITPLTVVLRDDISLEIQRLAQ